MAAERLSDTIYLYRFNEKNNTYTGTCIIHYKDEHKLQATIKGLATSISIDDRRELAGYLIASGITSCKYERRKNGVTLYKTWSLKAKCRVKRVDNANTKNRQLCY